MRRVRRSTGSRGVRSELTAPLGRLALLALALSLAPHAVGAQASSSSPAPPPAAELARRLQAHYDTVRDFTADFTHHYRGGVLRQSVTESGKVRIKKPGRMDWLYTSPEKKEFLSDGSKVYSYIAAENVVYITDLPPDDQASTALLFLSGRGNLVRDFRAALPATQPEGAWQIDLTPKTAQTQFAFLTLIVDPSTQALRVVSSTDNEGGVSTFVLTHLKENVGLSDAQFTFKIPKGAEVRR